MLNHIKSDDIIQSYSRQLAKTLFGGREDPAILGLDSTYFYIQKSSVSISTDILQSPWKQTIGKTMMIVSTIGHIVSALGDGKTMMPIFVCVI